MSTRDKFESEMRDSMQALTDDIIRFESTADLIKAMRHCKSWSIEKSSEKQDQISDDKLKTVKNKFSVVLSNMAAFDIEIILESHRSFLEALRCDESTCSDCVRGTDFELITDFSELRNTYRQDFTPDAKSPAPAYRAPKFPKNSDKSNILDSLHNVDILLAKTLNLPEPEELFEAVSKKPKVRAKRGSKAESKAANKPASKAPQKATDSAEKPNDKPFEMDDNSDSKAESKPKKKRMRSKKSTTAPAAVASNTGDKGDARVISVPSAVPAPKRTSSAAKWMTRDGNKLGRSFVQPHEVLRSLANEFQSVGLVIKPIEEHLANIQSTPDLIAPKRDTNIKKESLESVLSTEESTKQSESPDEVTGSDNTKNFSQLAADMREYLRKPTGRHATSVVTDSFNQMYENLESFDSAWRIALQESLDTIKKQWIGGVTGILEGVMPLSSMDEVPKTADLIPNPFTSLLKSDKDWAYLTSIDACVEEHKSIPEIRQMCVPDSVGLEGNLTHDTAERIAASTTHPFIYPSSLYNGKETVKECLSSHLLDILTKGHLPANNSTQSDLGIASLFGDSNPEASKSVAIDTSGTVGSSIHPSSQYQSGDSKSLTSDSIRSSDTHESRDTSCGFSPSRTKRKRSLSDGTDTSNTPTPKKLQRFSWSEYVHNSDVSEGRSGDYYKAPLSFGSCFNYCVDRTLELLNEGHSAVVVDRTTYAHPDGSTRAHTQHRAKLISSIIQKGFGDSDRGNSAPVTKAKSRRKISRSSRWGPVLVVVKVKELIQWEDMLREEYKSRDASGGKCVGNVRLMTYYGSPGDREILQTYMKPTTLYTERSHCHVVLTHYEAFASDMFFLKSIFWQMLVLDSGWSIVSHLAYREIMLEALSMKCRHRILSCAQLTASQSDIVTDPSSSSPSCCLPDLPSTLQFLFPSLWNVVDAQYDFGDDLTSRRLLLGIVGALTAVCREDISCLTEPDCNEATVQLYYEVVETLPWLEWDCVDIHVVENNSMCDTNSKFKVKYDFNTDAQYTTAYSDEELTAELRLVKLETVGKPIVVKKRRNRTKKGAAPSAEGSNQDTAPTEKKRPGRKKGWAAKQAAEAAAAKLREELERLEEQEAKEDDIKARDTEGSVEVVDPKRLDDDCNGDRNDNEDGMDIDRNDVLDTNKPPLNDEDTEKKDEFVGSEKGCSDVRNILLTDSNEAVAECKESDHGREQRQLSTGNTAPAACRSEEVLSEKRDVEESAMEVDGDISELKSPELQSSVRNRDHEPASHDTGACTGAIEVSIGKGISTGTSPKPAVNTDAMDVSNEKSISTGNSQPTVNANAEKSLSTGNSQPSSYANTDAIQVGNDQSVSTGNSHFTVNANADCIEVSNEKSVSTGSSQPTINAIADAVEVGNEESASTGSSQPPNNAGGDAMEVSKEKIVPTGDSHPPNNDAMEVSNEKSVSTDNSQPAVIAPSSNETTNESVASKATEKSNTTSLTLETENDKSTENSATNEVNVAVKAENKPKRTRRRNNQEPDKPAVERKMKAVNVRKMDADEERRRSVVQRGDFWQVSVLFPGRMRYLGSFATKQEAYYAYDRALTQRQKLVEEGITLLPKMKYVGDKSGHIVPCAADAHVGGKRKKSRAVLTDEDLIAQLSDKTLCASLKEMVAPSVPAYKDTTLWDSPHMSTPSFAQLRGPRGYVSYITSKRSVLGKLMESTLSITDSIGVPDTSGLCGVPGVVDIHIGNDPSVAREHAVIEYNTSKGSFEIKCLHNAGIFVGGKKILPSDAPERLSSKSIVQIGFRIFYFLLPLKPAFMQRKALLVRNEAHPPSPIPREIEHLLTTALISSIRLRRKGILTDGTSITSEAPSENDEIDIEAMFQLQDDIVPFPRGAVAKGNGVNRPLKAPKAPKAPKARGKQAGGVEKNFTKALLGSAPARPTADHNPSTMEVVLSRPLLKKSKKTDEGKKHDSDTSDPEVNPSTLPLNGNNLLASSVPPKDTSVPVQRQPPQIAASSGTPPPNFRTLSANVGTSSQCMSDGQEHSSQHLPASVEATYSSGSTGNLPDGNISGMSTSRPYGTPFASSQLARPPLHSTNSAIPTNLLPQNSSGALLPPSVHHSFQYANQQHVQPPAQAHSPLRQLEPNHGYQLLSEWPGPIPPESGSSGNSVMPGAASPALPSPPLSGIAQRSPVSSSPPRNLIPTAVSPSMAGYYPMRSNTETSMGYSTTGTTTSTASPRTGEPLLAWNASTHKMDVNVPQSADRMDPSRKQ
mmetsp:Transcript_206/g.375  ORF Transcript_206/g.375 Transcript_206/m.375 type:complete len:2241 (-) Transcript_206:47-6769(-)